MKKFRMWTIALLLALTPTFTFAARTIPGNVPELAPLQPIPENTQPNISGNIHNQTSSPEEEENNESQSAPEALEELQETLPLPLPEAQSSPWSWLIVAIVLVVVGGGIGYWVHIRKKGA